jgi:hypothetical protein
MSLGIRTLSRSFQAICHFGGIGNDSFSGSKPAREIFSPTAFFAGFLPNLRAGFLNRLKEQAQ